MLKPAKELFLGVTLILVAILVSTTCGTVALAADKYPSKPVVITIPFGTGGTTDISVRSLQPFLSEVLGVPVIAQNKGGAGGRIGATEVYKAEPDGYTLLAHNLPTIILGQLLFDSSYDVRKFVQVYGWVSGPRVVAVLPDSPYKTLADLANASKKKQLTAAIVGFGVTDHVQAVQMKEKVGVQLRAIPFGSGGKAIQALLGKNTDMALPAANSAKAHYDDKRIRILAITSAKPFPGFEGIPTFKELGYEGMELSVDTGLMAPPGTDQQIIKVLESAMEKAVHNPKYVEIAKKADEPLDPMNQKEWKTRIDEVYVQVEKLVPMLKADMKKKSK